jgi:hypothetical protein
MVHRAAGGGHTQEAGATRREGHNAASRFQKGRKKVSILNSKGSNATPGPIVIYQLITGQNWYSETAKEDGNSYIFEADKTLVIAVDVKNKAANINMQKVSDSIFAPKILRVPKSAVLMATDCGQPDLVQKAHEALSGIVLAGPGSVN